MLFQLSAKQQLSCPLMIPLFFRTGNGKDIQTLDSVHMINLVDDYICLCFLKVPKMVSLSLV